MFKCIGYKLYLTHYVIEVPLTGGTMGYIKTFMQCNILIINKYTFKSITLQFEPVFAKILTNSGFYICHEFHQIIKICLKGAKLPWIIYC